MILAGIKPAEVLVALIALAEGPGMSWKPGILKRCYSGLGATECLRECDDPEGDAIRVGKGELVFAFIFEAVLIDSDTVQTPGTKPVPFCLGYRDGGPRVQRGLANPRHDQLGFDWVRAARKLKHACR